MEGHEKSYNENKVQAWSFSGVSQVAVKNSPANARVVADRGSIPELGKSLEEGMATTPVFLPEESNGQRGLVGASP